MASPKFSEDRIWINGAEDNSTSRRLRAVLAEARRRVRANADEETQRAAQWSVLIVSRNNFPTAAGLASSAAGYAALAFALAGLYGSAHVGDVTTLARIGSGSACRSVNGGFVEWEMGERQDGLDSVGRQVVPHTHWRDMEVVILVASDRKKATSSTAGMQTSMSTSSLLQHRTTHVVPERMRLMKQAIHNKDFPLFAKLTMQDSNQFHSICLDTYPPIMYMTDVSRQVVRMITALNACYETPVAAYTFDAGPNAVIYTLKHHVPDVLACVSHVFPQGNVEDPAYLRGKRMDNDHTGRVPEEVKALTPTAEGLQYIFRTDIGDGPRTLAHTSLITDAGVPAETC